MTRKIDHSRAAFDPDARFALELEARRMRAAYLRAALGRLLSWRPRTPPVHGAVRGA